MVGVVFSAAELAGADALLAIDLSRQVRSLVSFDVNVRPALWTSHAAIRDTLAQVVQRTDILKFSADETAFLSAQERSSTEPLATNELNALGAALLGKGPALMILTARAH